ncbi:MAG: GNAT family N-acetyltransferase [Fimbriimonadaceae bacterium]
MGIFFEPVELGVLVGDLHEHYRGCGVIDSFLEGKIRESRHYRIESDGEQAGFASVLGGNRLTQFYLRGRHRRLGQAVFQAARRLENVDSAFVPTSDEFYLAHALDEYRVVEKQAYFFELGAGNAKNAPTGFELRPVTKRDIALVSQEVGDFLTDLPTHIKKGEVFVTWSGGTPVGIGVRQIGEFSPGVASIGMFTFEKFRRTGVGTATVSALIQLCQAQEIRPIAGCWYYNHASKKTLERAGMVAPTRLLRVLF